MNENDLEQAEWPVCVTPRCNRQLWVAEAGRYVCRPCEDRTHKHLAELGPLFRRLNETGTLMRGARRPGGATSGSRTPPIPPRLEVLALTANGGVAARLQAIEDSWRIALGRRIEHVRHDGARTFAPSRGWPLATVPENINFLRINLQRAVEQYESVGQDIDDIRRLHAECVAVVANEHRPGRVNIGRCPARGDDGTLCRADLTATASSHRVHCGACGARWETLGEWKQLREQQDAVLREDAGVAA